MSELWKPIAGYEDAYEISDLGRVCSFDRWVRNSRYDTVRYLPAQIMQPYIHTGGYLCVKLSSGRKKIAYYVHRLVAEAFIGSGADGQEVRHWDGNKTNNCAANLLWGTRIDNMDDRVRLDEHIIGSRHGMAKLNEEDVLAIRADYRMGKHIAADYNVSTQLISMIKTRRIWRHV